MRFAGARRGRTVTGVITAVIVVIAAGAFTFGFARLRTDAVSDLIDAGRRIAVVFMLPIDDPHPSFEVLMFDAGTGRAALLFVPGSIGVVLDRQRMDAIAALYGPEGHAALVERLGMLLDLDIDFYVDLSYEGLGRFIDVLGGVEVVIPDPIRVADGERRVLLPSGSVVVDGDMARDYLSYRAAEEPAAERVERVHRLLQGLLRSVADGAAVLADPTAQRLLYASVITDLSRRAFERLLAALARLDTDRVILRRVLGRIQDVSGRPLLFPHDEGAVLRETVKQTVAALSVPLGTGDAELAPSMEVLNGTRTSGLAAQAATVFESFGFRIVAVDNADHHDYERTLVFARRGDAELAQRAADVIRCDRSGAPAGGAGSVDSAVVDVTVILGRDFNGRFCRAR